MVNDMINCKIVSTDFDGTLLDLNKSVSLRNIESLKKCREKGMLVIGVTARTSNSVFSVVDRDIFDYFVLNNGTHLYDVKEQLLITISSISRNKFELIFDEMKSLCNEIDFCSGNYYYVYGNDLINKTFIKNIHSLSEIDEDIGRMNLFLLDSSKLEYYCNYINDKYADLNCFIMKDSDADDRWLVLLPKNVSKFSTLISLGNKLGIDKNEILFFGDGPNDIEVISNVGYGVAMENAVESVKKHSKYVTRSNNNNGVSYFLENNVFK